MKIWGGLGSLAGATFWFGGAFIGSASTSAVLTNITSQAVTNYAIYSTAAANVGAFVIELANPDPNGTPGLECRQGDEIARGIKLLFKQTAAALVKPVEKFLLNTSKLDYLFGKLEYQNLKGADLEEYAGKVGRTIESLTHNQDRASSMAKVFEAWGIGDNKAGFEKLADFFNACLNGKVVGTSKVDLYGTSVTREISLIFTAGEKKGQSAGSLQISYFYKNSDMSATPEISSVIPIPSKTP